jgi:hypothetical protein
MSGAIPPLQIRFYDVFRGQLYFTHGAFEVWRFCFRLLILHVYLVLWHPVFAFVVFITLKKPLTRISRYLCTFMNYQSAKFAINRDSQLHDKIFRVWSRDV